MIDRSEQIAQLLLQTGQAHHAAYFEADGADPDWPLWYAEYLQKRLPPLQAVWRRQETPWRIDE